MTQRSSANRKGASARKRKFSRIRKAVRSVRSWLLGGFLLGLVLATIGLVFPYLYDFLVNSPYLRLEVVTIEGADTKLQEALTQLCGLRTGRSIVSLKLNEIKTAMEGHPWVRSVKVQRRFPDQLWIRVERQEPIAVALIDGLHYFNRWGEVFKPLQEGDAMDFPIVTGLAPADTTIQDRLKRVVVVMEALKSEPAEWAVSNLSEINLANEPGLSLYFKTLRVEVRLPGSEVVSKMDELKKIVDHLKAIGRLQEAALIDLSYEAGGVVSFKRG